MFVNNILQCNSLCPMAVVADGPFNGDDGC